LCIVKAVSRYTNGDGHSSQLEVAEAESWTLLLYIVEPEGDKTLRFFIREASSLLPEKILFPLGGLLTCPF
jgi:hypothetical protein